MTSKIFKPAGCVDCSTSFKPTAASAGHPSPFRGRLRQLSYCLDESKRIEVAIGRRPSFALLLNQAPQVGGVDPSRLASMLCSVATGATTEFDHYLGEID